MARRTRTDFNLAGNTRTLNQEVAGALATLASGTNPDASAYTMPTSGTVATATAVATGSADVAAVAAATGLRLLGYSVRESAGSAAVASFNLRNGSTVAGAIVAVEELAADTAKTVWFGGNGIACASGIFLDRVAGDTEIVIYHAAIT